MFDLHVYYKNVFRMVKYGHISMQYASYLKNMFLKMWRYLIPL